MTLGDYLKARRLSLGMGSLKKLSDRTETLKSKVSIESLRRYELGYILPSVEALEVLAIALELCEAQKLNLLTLLATEKVQRDFPTVPILILTDDLISIISESLGSTLRLSLERSGGGIGDGSLSVGIQLEVVSECQKLLKGLREIKIPYM